MSIFTVDSQKAYQSFLHFCVDLYFQFGQFIAPRGSCVSVFNRFKLNISYSYDNAQVSLAPSPDKSNNNNKKHGNKKNENSMLFKFSTKHINSYKSLY